MTGRRRQAVIVVNGAHRKTGAPVLKRCTLPLTGAGVVDLLITDLGVFEIDRQGRGARLIELAPGVTTQELREKTAADYVEPSPASVSSRA